MVRTHLASCMHMYQSLPSWPIAIFKLQSKDRPIALKSSLSIVNVTCQCHKWNGHVKKNCSWELSLYPVSVLLSSLSSIFISSINVLLAKHTCCLINVHSFFVFSQLRLHFSFFFIWCPSFLLPIESVGYFTKKCEHWIGEIYFLETVGDFTKSENMSRSRSAKFLSVCEFLFLEHRQSRFFIHFF